MSRRICRPSPLPVALLTCFAVTQLSAPAWAYRPFDGTDAEVAEPGEVEIEHQPAGLEQQGSAKTLLAPTVVNFGLPDGWEAVFEAEGNLPISPSDQSSSVTGAAASLKHVWRPGSLQDVSGPSIATELGLLMPGIRAEPGFGVGLLGIVSQRFDWGTIHFNVEMARARNRHANLFVSTILEGPSTWTVRPVAEVYYEEHFGISPTVTISGLVGAIWQVRDNLAFDIAYRHGETNGQSAVNEIRAGVTFGFPIRLGSTPSAHREEYGPLSLPKTPST